ARLEEDAFARPAVMQDVGSVVEDAAEAVAAEITHHRASLGFGIGLDRVADVAGVSACLDGGDAALQALIGYFHQPFRLAGNLADPEHSARLPHPTLQEY